MPLGRRGLESEALFGKTVEMTPVSERERSRRARTVDSYLVGILKPSVVSSSVCKSFDCELVGAASETGSKSRTSDRRLLGSHIVSGRCSMRMLAV